MFLDPVVATPAEPQAPIPAAPLVAPPAVAPKSELQEFRERKNAAPAPEPPAAPVAAKEPEPVETPEPAATIDPKHIVEHEGEKYDMRTRAGKRILALKGTLKASEARIAELQAQIARQTPAPAAPAAPPVVAAPSAEDPEPDVADSTKYPAGEYDPRYLKDQARWEARQEIKAAEEKRTAADRAKQQETQKEAMQAGWDKKLPDVKQRYPDFDQAYDALYAALGQTGGRHRYLVHRLLESEIGHDTAHFLGTHPEAVTALFAAQTFDAHVRAIGELEAQVKASLKKPAAPAPPVHVPAPPIPPVGGTATVTGYAPETASLQQFRQRNGVLGGRRVG